MAAAPPMTRPGDTPLMPLKLLKLKFGVLLLGGEDQGLLMIFPLLRFMGRLLKSGAGQCAAAVRMSAKEGFFRPWRRGASGAKRKGPDCSGPFALDDD